MKFVIVFFILSSTAFAERCFYQGHPSKMIRSKCAIPKILSCGAGLFRCDHALFGSGICVSNKSQSILKSCMKESSKAQREQTRFHQKPAYEYDFFRYRVKEIEKLCTRGPSRAREKSSCGELLLMARSLNDFFKDHTILIDPKLQGQYGPECSDQRKALYPTGLFWLDQFTAHTEFIDQTKFPSPKTKPLDLKINKNSDFCLRKTDLIDTIVLHHTASTPTESIQKMNRHHLANGWYKIGYHYMIRADYDGQTEKTFFQTRDPITVGAHTGSKEKAYVKQKPSSKMIQDIACYKVKGKVEPRPKKLTKPTGEIKANFASIGVAIIGNFAPFHPVHNIAGYPPGQERVISGRTINKIAKLMCHLQERYPTVRYLKKHKDFQDTDCPGDLKKHMTKIIQKTKELGCDFSL